MKIVIVGDGKVGLLLTQTLSAEEDHDVTVVDTNARVLQRMQDNCDAMAVHGHGANRSVLMQAEADSSDLLIAATSSDEVNLLSCLVAKKIGCKNTIARVRSPEYADDVPILRQEMNLSLTVNPEESCAREINRMLQLPSFLARESFAKGRANIVKLHIREGSPLIGVPLHQLYARAKVKVLVCAVERGDDVVIPDGNFIIAGEDYLFIAASTEDLTALVKNLRLGQRRVTQVTIVGGGRVAVYLAMRLMRTGVGVKIIEKNPDRCQTLAEILPAADIVEGDGTEKEVLEAEGVTRSDALVALTDNDEENLILSMYMRQLGMEYIVTKCNRSQYSEMFRKMGVDMVVSPKASCADEIVSYVRAMENSEGNKMVTMHFIAGDRVEAMEFIAEHSARMLGVPLSALSLKRGILIACISRGRETIIPSGNSTIEEGDSVVIVSKGQHILDLNDIVEV